MTLRIVFDGQKAGAKLRLNMEKHSEQVRQAIQAAAEAAAIEIEELGREDIAHAGNFGSRWLEGFQARVTQGGGFTKITVTHAVPYWRVFQFGAVIEGRPLLWIPLSFSDAKGIRARDYPLPLFRVDRKSGAAPLLMAKGGVPKYFGADSVTIPKKFNLKEITRDVAHRLPDLYRQARANQR